MSFSSSKDEGGRAEATLDFSKKPVTAPSKGAPIKPTLAMIISLICCVLSAYDNSGSMYAFAGFVAQAMNEDSSRKKDSILGYAHFSCSLSTNGRLPQSGLTDIRLPFNELQRFISQHKDQRRIHVKMITDGGHNVSALKDFIASIFNALKYAFQQDVKLVFTVIMMGDYVRYNCWVCVLAYFAKMFNHDCYVVYKPSIREIMVSKTDSTGNTVWERIIDPHATSNDQFGPYISHGLFMNLSDNCGALCYANAFLKSSEMSGLDQEIKQACQKFWQDSIIASADSHASSDDSSSCDSTFKYTSDLVKLTEEVGKFFATPPRVTLSSGAGMNAMSDLFSATLLENGTLYMPFADMFDEKCQEDRINVHTSRAIPPPMNFVASTIGSPSRARLLELLVNLSTVNVASYNAFIGFIRVNFDILDRIVAVSIVKKCGNPIVKQSFVEAMIDMITNKRPFFPSMVIDPSKEDEYTRFISEVCKFCMVTSMDPYNEVPSTKRKDGLKQLLHVLVHLIFGMSANQGFSRNATIRNAQMATEFGKEGGFLQELIALPKIAGYLAGLYSNIIADEKVSQGGKQATEFSAYQQENSGTLFEIFILLETRKAHPMYSIFCKSFAFLYAKMVCGGGKVENPTRNHENMKVKEPMMLALAVLQALHPDDLTHFCRRYPDICKQYTISLQLTKKQQKATRCSACVTVIPATTQLVYVETKRAWYGQYQEETVVSRENAKYYPANSLREKPVPSRTIINRVDPCTDCFEEVPDSNLEVLSEKIFENPTFNKWLAEWMVTRNLDCLTSVPGKAGTADSPLTEVNKRFQNKSLQFPRQVSYYLSFAFGEADFIVDSFRALFSATSSPDSYDHLVPCHQKQLTNFRSEMLRFMSNEIVGLEKTNGAVKWMELLSVFDEQLTTARLHLQKIHAEEPEFSHGESVCHVCGFIVKEETVTDHEAEVLKFGKGFLPKNLLTPLCTENADGTMTLETINEATTIRMAVPKFQAKFQRFVKEYMPEGVLAKWHQFGGRPASLNTIKFLQKFRISTHQFMLLLKLQCGITYMCRFDGDCTLTAMYNLTDLDFKTNELNRVFPLDHSGYSATRSQIESQVRRIYN